MTPTPDLAKCADAGAKAAQELLAKTQGSWVLLVHPKPGAYEEDAPARQAFAAAVIAEHSRQLAEGNAGKSPGQVSYQTFRERWQSGSPWNELLPTTRDAHEAAASAVLATFGGKEAPPSMGTSEVQLVCLLQSAHYALIGLGGYGHPVAVKIGEAMGWDSGPQPFRVTFTNGKIDPPPFGKWHRKEWGPLMLGDDYRPLLLGEPAQECDEVLIHDVWMTNACDVGFKMGPGHLPTRTRRPLPGQPQPTLPTPPPGYHLATEAEREKLPPGYKWKHPASQIWSDSDSGSFGYAALANLDYACPDKPEPEGAELVTADTIRKSYDTHWNNNAFDHIASLVNTRHSQRLASLNQQWWNTRDKDMAAWKRTEGELLERVAELEKHVADLSNDVEESTTATSELESRLAAAEKRAEEAEKHAADTKECYAELFQKCGDYRGERDSLRAQLAANPSLPSLRDLFAASALQMIVINDTSGRPENFREHYSKGAFEWADAMLAARNAKEAK